MRSAVCEVPEGAESALASLPLPPGLDLLIDAPRLAVPSSSAPLAGDSPAPANAQASEFEGTILCAHH